jgi:hypothetical protein
VSMSAPLPALVIVVPIESTPRFYLQASSAEDEAALRGWLERVADELASRIADELLDAIEEEAA